MDANRQHFKLPSRVRAATMAVLSLFTRWRGSKTQTPALALATRKETGGRMFYQWPAARRQEWRERHR